MDKRAVLLQIMPAGLVPSVRVAVRFFNVNGLSRVLRIHSESNFYTKTVPPVTRCSLQYAQGRD